MTEPSGGGRPTAIAPQTWNNAAITGERQTISLHLEHLSELFELPETDLLSPGRANYNLTGMDVALSELRGHPDRGRPVRLEINVPAAEAAADGEQAVACAVQHYCDARINYNRSERRAALIQGVGSLKVGLPVAAVGIIMVIVFQTGVVADVIGAVLIWVGLWHPLDQLLFRPSEWTRDNRPLQRLRDAEVVLRARGCAEPGSPPAMRSTKLQVGAGGPNSEPADQK